MLPVMPDLRPYQHTAVDFLTEHGRAILAYPPGTGKTATVSRWLSDLPGFRVLVVCPNGPVLQHWKDEMWRWGELAATIGTGTKIRRHRSRTFSTGGLILNYECMRQDIDELVKIPWDAVVFDESHRLKNRKALVFKAAAKLARRTPRIALVTGTPILNSADELWTSLHMLEPARYKSFWRWADYHFDVTTTRHRGRAVQEVGALKSSHAALLRESLTGSLIQRPLAELLPDLPPVTETYLHVDLTPPERAMYDSMKANFWMEHGADLTVAPNKISQSLRLRQLASDWSAFIGVAEWGFGIQLGAKGKAAVDLIADLAPEQVLVFCAFRHTVDALVHALDGQAAPYHGGHSAEGRAQAIADFKSGRRRVLVGTLATLGEGVDGLQVARNMIMVDRDWTPARNEQAIGRLRRSGQRSAVNVVHLVANDTIDQVVSAALARKQSVIEAVLSMEAN